MSNAWETTTEDVINVLSKHQIHVDETTAKVHHGNLDHDLIEAAALHGDTMDEQTEYAYQEIWTQLKDMSKEFRETSD